MKVLVEGEKRVKITKYNENKDNFLNCEVEIIEDENNSKNLELLAVGLIKKYEKLQILNKKDFTDSPNNLKKLKRSISNCK